MLVAEQLTKVPKTMVYYCKNLGINSNPATSTLRRVLHALRRHVTSIQLQQGKGSTNKFVSSRSHHGQSSVSALGPAC